MADAYAHTAPIGQDHPVNQQEEFFAAVARRNLVRPAVRAIVRGDRGFLVQRPTDDPNTNYAFIGGEYEVGDSFESRIRREFEEETDAQVLRVEYRFVVENRFRSGGELVQTLEHYCEVKLDRERIISREPQQEQFWLSLSKFAVADVRPTVVRDAVLSTDWRNIRHLEVRS